MTPNRLRALSLIVALALAASLCACKGGAPKKGAGKKAAGGQADDVLDGDVIEEPEEDEDPRLLREAEEAEEARKVKAEFQVYQARAKTTEAMEQLDRIYKGAAMYFSVPHLGPDGAYLPCQFPASAAATPSPKGCADPAADKDGDGRCDLDDAAWAALTWTALMFQPAEPHYFVYRFDSQGIGNEAIFTASAFGDLDRDGVLSTFQRSGKGTTGEKITSCVAQPVGDLTVKNEIE